jgi:hypothetical protein
VVTLLDKEEFKMSGSRLTLALALVATLAIPSMAAADPSAERNAAKACKQLRGEMGAAVFKQTFGTNKNKSNAFGKCVSSQVKGQRSDTSNAAEECKAERAEDPEAFKDKYGTNKNKSNAYGKCVSQKAKEQPPEQPEPGTTS